MIKLEELFEEDHIITREDCKMNPNYLRIKRDVGKKYVDIIPEIIERRNKYAEKQRLKKPPSEPTDYFVNKCKKAYDIWRRVKKEEELDMCTFSHASKSKERPFCSIHFDTQKDFIKFIKGVFSEEYCKKAK